MALATTALLFGHALWIDRDGPRARRLVRIAPYLLVVFAWQAIYSASGYGVTGSGGYVHPLHDPRGYFAQLPARALVLALGQLTPFASDFWPIYPPPARLVVAALAVSLLLVVARLAWPRVASERSSRLHRSCARGAEGRSTSMAARSSAASQSEPSGESDAAERSDGT